MYVEKLTEILVASQMLNYNEKFRENGANILLYA